MSRILILEDEKVVARDLQGILTTFGYETSLASSGEEAIGVAKRDKPDVALVDIHLAGSLDGIETAQALRQQTDVGVVYLTAHGDEETLERAESTEPLGYLVKPFSEPTLKATLQMAVVKAGIERRNRSEREWRAGVLDRLTVGLITVDTAGNIRMMNAKAQKLTGWSDAEALGKKLVDILILRDGERALASVSLLDAALRGVERETSEGALTLVSKSGEEMSVEYGASPVHNEDAQIIGASVVFWPARAEEGNALPDTVNDQEWDATTGLPGRAQAKAALHSSLHTKTKTFAALFVLERYHRTSRRYGLATADEVLTYYCTFLAQEVQASPHCIGLYRWTGPSFLALLGPWDSLSIAQREIARFTRLKLVEEFQANSRSVLLPVSAALKVLPLSDIALDKLIGQLDSFLALQTKIDDDLGV